jgi:hypothetical protein
MGINTVISVVPLSKAISVACKPTPPVAPKIAILFMIKIKRSYINLNSPHENNGLHELLPFSISSSHAPIDNSTLLYTLRTPKIITK